MFENLTDRLNGAFARLSSKGRLDEADIDEAMKEVRRALLEADVNFKVVKQFVDKVKERAIGAEVLKSLTPAQMVVGIVHEQLIELLGEASKLNMAKTPPSIIMMVGLQGSGKTTTAAKLALQLRKAGQNPLLVAADVYRPAAVQQLQALGKQLGVIVYSEPPGADPVNIAINGVRQAQMQGHTPVILDTAGRLHIDDDLMSELAEIKSRVKPHDVLLVVDAMTGQDAVNVAEQFAEVTEFDGVLMSKLDGDARGGAALSVKAVTGKPILYASTGEKLEQLERFHPDRMAQRILGMGDVLSLIEKAEQDLDQSEAEELERKMRQDQFTLDDFLKQLKQVRKMGPLSSVLGMMPGMGKAMKEVRNANLDDRELDRLEAMILSMTPEERANPDVIRGSRRRRIAAGSGTNVQAVKQLTKQFDQMRKMMKMMASGKMPSPESMLRGQLGARRR